MSPHDKPKSKDTALYGVPPQNIEAEESIISAILIEYHDGYEAMYLPARVGGHTHLQDTIEHDVPSLQTRDMNLLTYLQKWQAYLYKEFLNGVHHFPWYLLDAFLKNLHPEVEIHLNRSLKKELIKNRPSDVLPGSDILPGSVFPDKIIVRLSRINKSV